jgi:rare lipoprotein A
MSAFGFARAWADPAASGETAASASADQTGFGTGLKLPPGSIKDNVKAADIVAAPMTPPTVPVVADTSLATVKRSTANKPRLGRQLGKGIATWYGPSFRGRRTANGERFDPHALTAAHKTLPLGTRVMVSNPRTGKQVMVRINDRGPYIGNYVLDLSEAAARTLGLKTRGHDWVVLNAVLPPSNGSNTAAYTIAISASN